MGLVATKLGNSVPEEEVGVVVHSKRAVNQMPGSASYSMVNGKPLKSASLETTRVVFTANCSVWWMKHSVL